MNYKCIKAVSMILESLFALRKVKQHEMLNKMDVFNENCLTIQKDIRQYNLATAKGWEGALEKVKARLIRNTEELKLQLDNFKDYLNLQIPAIPKPGDIYKEIAQLEFEYEYVEVSDTNGMIKVLTDNVELEEFNFGCFKIELNLKDISNLNTMSPYRVIAQSPYSAASDPEVTHPHVHSNKLCEGDGFNSIRSTLTQGRLTDFFMIVDSILNTYNPDSPFVSLEDWEGISCYECGYTVSGDDRYCCEICYNDFCPDCSIVCENCDMTVCHICSFSCNECDIGMCSECKETCNECGNTFCSDCINDGYCESCADKRKENEDEEYTVISRTAVQSDGMGQTNIYA